ncbi:hypothetical protein SAMN05192553_101954 [Cyclobacterium xiamenense]|uniref:Uncharacterized protein n=1 Tax=Cyclobacterium xiamenense TaxID=1297121 RepID=A0A1H6UXQ9_9BACT|nr:hypothetical protein [Cyclobacterium xiamenense]SEI94397.1 hypothetical protein SAMN05192553_101954 [Cyclobacterium xiamenense]
MKVTLDIKDSKAAAFLNFVKSLDFIRIQDPEDFEEPNKQEVLENIRQGMKEVKLHQEGKVKLHSARDFLDEL